MSAFNFGKGIEEMFILVEKFYCRWEAKKIGAKEGETLPNGV